MRPDSAYGSWIVESKCGEGAENAMLIAAPIDLGPNSILQDDNARPHRAGFIRDYLQNLGVERMESPASSPNLNPIEHVWDHLGRAVCARVTNTTTVADLRQMLVEEWDAIPQQCVTRLVTTMRRRCQAVVAVYGSSTHY
ncbi:caspase-13-like protein [Lates japonicus]|uniref:Caspase-13-like protein n=1 Tax=Lates japonicus TaxID=270547 RepID=A0AAD3N9C7_LATJO|nr:caspase-13-like protein [Lates japonicus]